MSGSASYVFLPWVRRGVATHLDAPGGDGKAGGPRANVTFEVGFNGRERTVPITLSLFGPGDVVGLDPRAVTRVWPGADVFEAETNLFPLVEIEQADFPWRYTPAGAGADDRLTPWLCLVVLAESEIQGYLAAGPKQPLSAVKLAGDAPLPPLSQAWAWAHCQVIGDSKVDAATLADRMAHEPHRVVARLVCPRRLTPRTPYVALLVPTFKRGLLAGMGQAVDDAIDALELAWKDGDTAPFLPYFHSFRFQTGGEGDFEYLARRIQPRKLPSAVGKRDMDVTDPGAGLPRASRAPLALEGALAAPEMASSDWPAEDRAKWIDALISVLNRPAEILQKGGDPVLSPPLYGRWHAAKDKLAPGQPPRWFQDLNSDPRLRATAALGTLVVQEQREALLAGAWQQVERIRALNDELRSAQLAREAALRLHARHFETGGIDAVLTVTAQAHARILDGATTVRKQLADSPIPAGVLEGQWRRVSRRMGPLGRRQGRPESAAPHRLLEKLNQGSASPAPPPRPPPPGTCGTLSPGDLGGARDGLDHAPHYGGGAPFGPFEPVPGKWDWAPVSAFDVGNFPPPPVDHEPEFRDAAKRALDSIRTPAAPDARKQVDLSAMRAAVLDALDPRRTIEDAVARRIRRSDGGGSPEDPIEPILAAPEFPQPMYEPLRDLSQDWLLPGLESVPADTATLLVANAAFIEAYMVGLNHEMARALLFEEFPTDQRGTYFRRFWDVSGSPAAPAGGDIEPIHTWKKGSPIGENSRRPPSGNDYLVLLLRGELLRRYPRTVIYAVEAVTDPATGKHVLGKRESHPLFRGTLPTDVTFLGFDLDAKVAAGLDGGAGWFFVIQEQPTSPRFGLTLDDPAARTGGATRANLAWKDFAADLDALVYLDISGDLPAIKDPGSALWSRAQVRSADIASVTWRQPGRVAIHARRMLSSSLGT